jgi:hypothetical protein
VECRLHESHAHDPAHVGALQHVAHEGPPAPLFCAPSSTVMGPIPAIGPRSSTALLPMICPSRSATTT